MAEATGRSNPWRVLRERPHLHLEYADLGDGLGRIEQRDDGTRLILIERSLDQCRRSATLLHELVHDELDMLWPPGTLAYPVQKGEHRVEREAVQQMVPRGEVADLVRRRVDLGEGVCPLDVAEHFEIPVEEARQALELFACDGYRRSA